MIYSVHDPYTGQFRYFEAGPEVAINNDLPTPQFDAAIRTKIGVPASEAARPLPSGARQVGTGALPVGSMSSGRAGLWQGTAKGSGIPSGLGAFQPNLQGFGVMTLLVGAGASVVLGATKGEKGWPLLALGGTLLLGAMFASGGSGS